MGKGQKRGVPASSSGSSSRKSGGNGSGGRSGGLARGEGGPEQRKETSALQEAKKLSDARQQSSLLDVKKVRWALKTDPFGVRMSFDGFKDVLRRRRRLFKRVMSLHVRCIPVTQLNSGPKETYHIVEISIDGRVVLQFLFRQSDGYLLAFSLVKNEENPLAWEGWFHFNDPDIILPDFFGDRRSVEWDCGYLNADLVSICKHTMDKLVSCLLDFKPENCTKTSFGGYDRVRVLQTWMILLGECQRSAEFLKFVERHLDSEEPFPLGKELDDHFHSWSNISKIVLHIHLALLMREYEERGWEYVLQSAEDQLTALFIALTSHGFNLIRRYIVYHPLPDGSDSDRPSAELSFPRLLGTEDGHYLHLIKCDASHVQNIHKLMKKRRKEWPDPGTEPDTP